jgi:antitoxin component YwqK of YwqJK toxin-antitoxin module
MKHFFAFLIFFLSFTSSHAQLVVDYLHPTAPVKADCHGCDTIKLCNGWSGYGATVNGKKQGLWTYSHIVWGSRSLYSGKYVDGKKEGEWHTAAGDVEYTYKNNLLDGEVRYYSHGEQGRELYKKHQYAAGKAHGDWIEYDNGKPVYITHYKNGFPDGIWESTNGSGVTWRGPVNAQGRHGRWNAIANDTVKGGGEYVNGKEEGYWFDYQGVNMYSKGNFKNGKKEGRWEYVTGAARSITAYSDDLKNGADSMWFNDTLHSVFHYKNGQANGSCIYYYRNGSPKESWLYAGDSAIYKTFYKNGAVESSGSTVANPEFVAMAKRYSRRNAAQFPPELLLDLVERSICGVPFIYGGDFINADADSAERYMRSEQYRLDTMDRGPLERYPPYELRTGTWTFYYENGMKKEEGEYLPKAEGYADFGDEVYFKTGRWKVYNEKGKLVREEFYKEGKLLRTQEKR